MVFEISGSKNDILYARSVTLFDHTTIVFLLLFWTSVKINGNEITQVEYSSIAFHNSSVVSMSHGWYFINQGWYSTNNEKSSIFFSKFSVTFYHIVDCTSTAMVRNKAHYKFWDAGNFRFSCQLKQQSKISMLRLNGLVISGVSLNNFKVFSTYRAERYKLRKSFLEAWSSRTSV